MNLAWDFDRYNATIYRSSGYLHEVVDIDSKPLESFFNLDREIEILKRNTESFLFSKCGLNVLLWGARGCGKSSLIKSIFNKYQSHGLKICQILKHDIEKLPEILDFLRTTQYKIIIFCDDISFESSSKEYKMLQTILEGSIERFPQNILIYATTNKKHLSINENSDTYGFSGDDESISLSDRFPIKLSFYSYGSLEFLELISLKLKRDEFESIKQKALNYAAQVGSKSPRVAMQFLELYKNNLLELI